MATARTQHAGLGAGYLYTAGRTGTVAIITQGLKFAFALWILVGFQWLGEWVVWLIGGPIHGPLMGMLLLLIPLTIADHPLAFLHRTSNLLIQNLSLMFMPIAVGAFFLSREIYQQFPAILLIIVMSTCGVILFMALLIRGLTKDD